MTTKIGLDFLDAEVANTITAAASAFDTLGANGQVLTSNGTALVWAEASGGGGSGGSFQAVAAGSIDAGKGVVLNTNGTVSAVAETASSYSTTTPGNIIAYTSTGTLSRSGEVSYSPSREQALYAYNPSGSSLQCVVGNISTNSVTWGTAASLNSVTPSRGVSVSYDNTQNNFVVCFSNTSGTYLVTATPAAGPSVVYGTPVLVLGTQPNSTKSRVRYSPSSSKHMVFYEGGNILYCRVATVTGANISLGTQSTVKNIGNTTTFGVSFSPVANAFLVAYGTSSISHGRMVSINGTSANVEAEVLMYNAGVTTSLDPMDVTYNSSVDRFIVTFLDISEYPRILAVSANSTTPSFGTSQVVPILGSTTVRVNSHSAVHDPSSNNNMYFVSRGGGGTDMYMIQYDVSNTTITMRTGTAPFTANAIVGQSSSSWGAIQQMIVTFASNTTNKAVMLFSRDSSGAGATYATLATPYKSISNFVDWIGVSGGTYSNNVTANVTIIGGINESVTGLTPNSKYYLNANGTLTTNVTSSGVVGRALANNKLLVTGNAYP